MKMKIIQIGETFYKKPDHRYCGTLVLDAAYMVTVPKILPEVPFLEKNPVFLYTYDQFVHPEPFIPDVCIDIDDVMEKKIDMYHQHTSQMYEWLPFNRGQLDQVPKTEKERRATIGESVSGFWDENQWEGGFEGMLDRFRFSKTQKDWCLTLD